MAEKKTTTIADLGNMTEEEHAAWWEELFELEAQAGPLLAVPKNWHELLEKSRAKKSASGDK